MEIICETETRVNLKKNLVPLMYQGVYKAWKHTQKGRNSKEN